MKVYKVFWYDALSSSGYRETIGYYLNKEKAKKIAEEEDDLYRPTEIETIEVDEEQ